MRIVIALGGNALLRRSDQMTTEVQRRNIKIAAEAIAPLAAEHSIVVVHGNGPQVGLLSLQAESYQGAEPYPLDVLDAGTQGMIGYLIQQELRSLLPQRQVATLQKPARGRRSARWPTSPGSWLETRAPASSRRRHPGRGQAYRAKWWTENPRRPPSQGGQVTRPTEAPASGLAPEANRPVWHTLGEICSDRAGLERRRRQHAAPAGTRPGHPIPSAGIAARRS